MTGGICHGMTDGEYFAHPAIDQTLLKRFMESPRAYAWARLHPSDTGALAFGRAAHSLVLDSGPTVEPRLDGRTTEGKEQRLRAEHDDLVLLGSADWEKLSDMMANKPDMRRLSPGRPEVAVFATDPETGLELKCKIDWLPDRPDDDGTMRLYDYKTTGHAATDFNSSAYRFGYHVQAAFYMMLYRRATGYAGPLRFRFVVQEKQPPYDWMLYEMDEADPEIGMVASTQIRDALDRLSFYVEHEIAVEEMLGQGLPKTPTPVRFTDWQMNHLMGDE